MQSSLLALLLPPLLLVPAMGLLSRIPGRGALHREIRRKSFHVGIGLTALCFPLLLTEPWMILAGLSLAVAWMAAVKISPGLRRHFGGVLHDCERRSMGEIYFALAIAALLLATQDSPLLYAIPVLVLALADAAAAIIGSSIPSRPLHGFMRGKSVAGCTAFLAVAFAVCVAMLGKFTDLNGWQIGAAAMVVAIATSIAEAASRRGLDNLTVPLVAWAVLCALDLSAEPAAVFGADFIEALQPLIEGAM